MINTTGGLSAIYPTKYKKAMNERNDFPISMW